MNDETTDKAVASDPQFVKQIGAKTRRKLKARRNSVPGVWFGLGISARTPLTGQLLTDSEAQSDQREVEEIHLFDNRPKSEAVYTPVHQRLLPLDEIGLAKRRPNVRRTP